MARTITVYPVNGKKYRLQGRLPKRINKAALWNIPANGRIPNVQKRLAKHGF